MCRKETISLTAPVLKMFSSRLLRRSHLFSVAAAPAHVAATEQPCMSSKLRIVKSEYPKA
jgi:hypothetical protein